MSKLYSNEDNYRSYKALIASKYSGKSLSVEQQQQENSKNFFARVPTFESSNVNLFDTNAIAYYLSNEQLRGGKDEATQAQVLQWLSYSSSDLWPAVFAWTLPATGCSNVKQTMEPAKNEVKMALKMLNEYLMTRTYLVGERITLADICMTITLLPLYQFVLEPSVRNEYGNVNRYFLTLINQKEFMDVIGHVQLCTQIVKQQQQQHDNKKKDESKKQEKKKEEPKKQEKKLEKKQDDAGDDDLMIPEMPKPKDPFQKFPAGKWNMDDFKRFYSNNPEDKSIPYFWEKFDKDHYSLWYCEYKYPEELTQVFMSCNLISGMFQRLDRMRKNAFASMILFGEDNNSTISGIWVWRGHELAFPLSEDWTVDYESYEWKKLDADDEKTKTMVKEYFSWEGEFGGKKFNQGKIFK